MSVCLIQELGLPQFSVKLPVKTLETRTILRVFVILSNPCILVTLVCYKNTSRNIVFLFFLKVIDARFPSLSAMLLLMLQNVVL